MEEDKKEEIEIVKVTEELIKAKNNSERFASDFAFKLTKEEVNNFWAKKFYPNWGGLPKICLMLLLNKVYTCL